MTHEESNAKLKDAAEWLLWQYDRKGPVMDSHEAWESLRAALKPAPAPIPPKEWRCPYVKGDILVCDGPTNFHEVGEVVMVEATQQRYAGDSRPYWVSLHGKPGHYSWENFRKATAEEIATKLASA